MIPVAVNESLRRWIQDSTGIEITGQNQAPVDLALRTLAEGRGLDPLGYVDGLLKGRIPSGPFVDAITTHESYFFRAQAQMSLAVERIIPERMSREPGRPVRVLSAPCARGEEPYTLAMMLRERGIPSDAVRILGLDISGACIEEARGGLYGPPSLRRTRSDTRDRWFRPAGPNRYRLDPSITAAVELRRLNLLTEADALPSGAYDLIFCENLLIYFDAPTTDRALAVLQRLLHPHGWLFVDHAEWNLPRGRFRMEGVGELAGFRPVDASSPALPPPRPAARPRPTPRPAAPSAATHAPAPATATARTPAAQRLAPPEASLREAQRLYGERRLVEALQGFEAVLAQWPGHPGALLGKARLLADCGEDMEAMECAEALLRNADTPDAGVSRELELSAMALLAVLLRKKGLEDMARRYLGEIARLDPRHPALTGAPLEIPHG